MITSITAGVFLLLAAYGISVLTHRRMEACLPVTFCGCILWLYGFYCFGGVRLGLVLFCLGCVGLFLFGLKRMGGFRECVCHALTPGMAVYLGVFLICLLFFSSNRVLLHDELRLWGAVPKAIYETGALQLGEDSPIFSIMQSYPPALPLIEYFFTAFWPEFSQGALYVAYTALFYSFLAPAFSQWEWKDWRLLLPLGTVALLIPVVFTSHCGDNALFGMTLFVDPLLGITTGYAFYFASRQSHDRFQLWEFSLVLAVLCLLKSTGLVFAASALVVFLVLHGQKGIWMPLLGLLVGALSWRLLLNRYDVQPLNPLTFHHLSAQAISNVLQAMTSINLIAYKLPVGWLLSFMFLFPVLLGLYWISCRIGKEQGKHVLITVLAITISTVAFVYGYALIYGETLESFPRYMATPLLCLAACIFLTLVPTLAGNCWIGRIRPRIAGTIGVLCMAVGLVTLAVWHHVYPPSAQWDQAMQDAALIREAIAQASPEEDRADVYLVMAGSEVENSLYHHTIYFDLISRNSCIRNYYDKANVLHLGWEQWTRELAVGYDYVYLLSLEDGMKEVFFYLGVDEPVAGTLYRVSQGDTITLKECP